MALSSVAVAPETSSVQIVSVLLDGAPASSAYFSASTVDASSTTLVGKDSYLNVLANVGHAMASEAEAEEQLNQINSGILSVQVCSPPWHVGETDQVVFAQRFRRM